MKDIIQTRVVLKLHNGSKHVFIKICKY